LNLVKYFKIFQLTDTKCENNMRKFHSLHWLLEELALWQL
jgi:hypothetical protein